MSRDRPLVFRIAKEPAEFEAIHRLNYRTFVEEIPQHAPNAEERLVDRFHAENTYAVCMDGDELVGMVAGRAERPFSLDGKLPDLDSHLPAGRRPVEIRLLSVLPSYRNGVVFSRLVGTLARRFREHGYDLAVISGTLRQTRLYRHLGFTPFGPVVGTGDALFQPMYLTLEDFLRVEKTLTPPKAESERVLANYLPGPVTVRAEVRTAFSQSPVSHRSAPFCADLRSVKRMLCSLTGAAHVEVLLGSGTLANDAVGGQLSVLGGRGIVLSNGEFGDRLADHASRWRLDADVFRTEWGRAFDLGALRARLAAEPALRWVWAVHCETSTGVLNDLGALKDAAAERGAALCLDGISSIGTLPVDLRGVYLASCVGGKALASYPGLSMVFHDHEIVPSPLLPRYLDLGLYASGDGVPYTTSSNLLHALQASLAQTDWPARYARIAAASARLRAALREKGLALVGDPEHAAPAVVTIALPAGLDADTVGSKLEERGVLVSCRSGYLLRRRWLQVCLMGEWDEAHLARMPDVLAEVCGAPSRCG